MTLFKTMLIINSNPNNILKVENYLSKAKMHFNLKEDKYPDILISITEAVNNAIIHGNGADESKKVSINMSQKAKGIQVSISDEGNGFNPSNVPDPTHPDNVECCGGRGVFIMNQLADKLSYSNNGSTVQMFFKLS